MRLDRNKLQICLARKKMCATDLRGCGIGCNTITKAMRGEPVTTKVAGKIADALGVDISDILAGKED